MKKADSQASGDIKPEPPAAIEGRDPGVSDEIWAELQHAKKVHWFCELGRVGLMGSSQFCCGKQKVSPLEILSDPVS